MSVRATIEGSVARLTLDRPPLNVITTSMLAAMDDELQRFGANEALRLIRIESAGDCFSAGVDVGDHLATESDAMMHALEGLFLTFERLEVPTVAVVRGAALGGGCELCLATDLCLADESASFGLPEIKLGLLAPPATVLLPRIVGERRAAELLLTGRTIDAAEAERIGLVNRLLPADGFDEALEPFAALSAAALRHAKRALRRARGLSTDEAHRAVNLLYRDELMQTEDAREGLSAFLEKRAPRWKHR